MVNEATEALLEADDDLWQGDLNEGIAGPKKTEERSALKVSRSTGTARSNGGDRPVPSSRGRG